METTDAKAKIRRIPPPFRYPLGGLAQSVLVEVSRQVCDGMSELSSRGLVHRDLSTHNVLVYSFHKAHPDLVSVRVSDYGVRYRGEGGGDFIEVLGSAASRDAGVRWMPPEAIMEGSWGKGSDVWAFGVTMWEIWSGGGGVPFQQIGEDDEVCNLILASSIVLQAPDGCPEDVYAVMSSCWRHAPADRPSYAVLARRFANARFPLICSLVAQHSVTLAPSLCARESPPLSSCKVACIDSAHEYMHACTHTHMCVCIHSMMARLLVDRRLAELGAANIPDSRMCAKCAAKPRGWVSFPCGHDIYCRECGSFIVGRPCVVCLRPVTNISEVMSPSPLP